MKRRAQWFALPHRPYFVMWRVSIGILRTLAEALDRLARLRRDGPSPDASGWGNLPGQRIWDQA